MVPLLWGVKRGDPAGRPFDLLWNAMDTVFCAAGNGLRIRITRDAGMFVLFLLRLVAASCVSFARALTLGLCGVPHPKEGEKRGPRRGDILRNVHAFGAVPSGREPVPPGCPPPLSERDFCTVLWVAFPCAECFDADALKSCFPGGLLPIRGAKARGHSAECPCLRLRAFLAKSGPPSGRWPAGERTSKEAGEVFAIPGGNGV